MTSKEKQQLGAILIVAGLFILAPQQTSRILHRMLKDEKPQPIEVVDIECIIVEDQNEIK